MSSKRRIAVTGMGVVSPVGSDLDTAWTMMREGRSGIGPLTKFDCTDFPVKIAGEVRDFDPDTWIPRKDQRRMDPFTIYGLAAAKMAVTDAGLNPDREDPERIGVMVGSGTGGANVWLEQARILDTKGPGRFSPFMVPQMIINNIGGYVAIEYGFRGPNFGLVSACTSATNAIGESMRMIQYGDADVMIAGGAEGSLNELGVGGFCAIRALTFDFNETPEKASRPFDKNRSGFVNSEGAGVLVLESWEHAEARGARIYAELAGYGRTCDAHHITAPDPDGAGAARAMELALQDAGLNAEDVDYINAHGTSTSLNDTGETRAIKKAFGKDQAYRIPISSTKSVTGHLLGAAGGIEAIASIFAIRNGILPPTINYETPDPDCDLDYVPNTAREADVEVAITNSLGFGGHNGCLCFKRA